MASSFKTSILKSSSGAELSLNHMTSSTKAKAVVQINHGMAEHSLRYKRFATALSTAGYHVFAHDHRGHGKTISVDAPQGVFAKSGGLKKVVEDIDTVANHIKETCPKLPIAMLGHSMGSILTLRYLIDHSKKIDAAMLLNSGVDGGPLLLVLRTLIKIAKAMKGSDVPAALITKLTFDEWNKKFEPNRTEFDWLSRDDAEVDKYIADPKCGFMVSNGLWLDITDAIKTGADNEQLTKIRNGLPFFLLAGAMDPCTLNGKSMERLTSRLKKTGNTDTTYSLLPDTRHESLNELNRDQITKDMIAWLDERFA